MNLLNSSLVGAPVGAISQTCVSRLLTACQNRNNTRSTPPQAESFSLAVRTITNPPPSEFAAVKLLGAQISIEIP